MAKSYAVQRTIHAPPERVWERLLDGAAYPSWNPEVVSLSGRIAGGETIALVSAVNPKRTFSLKVSEVQEPSRMVWSSGMPLGLFSGVRTFSLRPRGDGETDFSMEEVYSGPLAPLIVRTIPDLTASFERFAQALADASEQTDS